MNELGVEDRRETGRWPNNRQRTRICRSDDANGRGGASGACAPGRSSPSSAPLSPTTSTRNAAPPADPSSSRTGPLHAPSDAVPARHKGPPNCPR
jgi:hypothetical protein